MSLKRTPEPLEPTPKRGKLDRLVRLHQRYCLERAEAMKRKQRKKLAERAGIRAELINDAELCRIVAGLIFCRDLEHEFSFSVEDLRLVLRHLLAGAPMPNLAQLDKDELCGHLTRVTAIRVEAIAAMQPPQLWDWPVGPGEAPIPISWPVTRRYMPLPIIEWRSWIGRQTGARPDFGDFTVQHLRTLYDLYNRHFFNNALPQEVVMEISDKMTSTAGKCITRRIGLVCTYTLRISRPLLRQLDLASGRTTESGGVECRTALECLQLVVEHEMLHLALRYFGQYALKLQNKQRYSSHGQLFKQLLDAYFGQTRATHNIGRIIASDEQGGAVTKESVEIGDAVSTIASGREKAKRGIVTVKNPQRVVVTLPNNQAIAVMYRFLVRISPEELQQDATLSALADQVLAKYAYFLKLKANDKITYGGGKPATVVAKTVSAGRLKVSWPDGRQSSIRYTLLDAPLTLERLAELARAPQPPTPARMPITLGELLQPGKKAPPPVPKLPPAAKPKAPVAKRVAPKAKVGAAKPKGAAAARPPPQRTAPTPLDLKMSYTPSGKGLRVCSKSTGLQEHQAALEAMWGKRVGTECWVFSAKRLQQLVTYFGVAAERVLKAQ